LIKKKIEVRIKGKRERERESTFNTITIREKKNIKDLENGREE